MYGYNAGPPMAIPIYTVLPYCVVYSQEHIEREPVIPHSVNVNSKIQTWRTVGLHMFSVFHIWNKSDITETQTQLFWS